MKIAVIGAGKMGLPLACQFAHRGGSVTACDINPTLVAAINEGRCLINEPGVPELLTQVVGGGRLRATTEAAAAVSESDVAVIIVPALLTEQREIDVSVLEAATREVARGLHRGMMVCYETTLPVGGTRRYLKPVLERSGLRAGEDFDLAFSPERVKSQSVLRHLAVNPKIVGGITPAAADRAAAFYGDYLGAPVINLVTLEASEMAKLIGMVYRDVNIALSNELARYAEAVGVDLRPVIAAANTDGEAHLLDPGIGVGGHCTPVYPYFLTRDSHERGAATTLVERARRINDLQAGRTLERVEREWSSLKGRRVLILGLGFRPQVKEHAYSTAFLLRDELRRRGAEVRLHDPLYEAEEIRAHGFTPGSLEDRPAPEVLILNTAHPAYRALRFADLAQHGTRVVVDGRNIWSADQVGAARLVYFGIGQPSAPSGRRHRRDLPVARPALAGEEAEAAADVVRSGWVTQGPQVAAFEEEFAAAVGAPFACAVSSCTTALHLALHALGIGRGDEVITPSHSFIATANAVRYCGAVPVFVDIDPRTYNLDPAQIEQAVTSRTKAILPVHQMGLPCDLSAILAIGERYGLAVIEDAACAIGSAIRVGDRWEPIGRPHGRVACFSFHPRKVITTGDGGMLTTSDPALDRAFRLLRQHGMSVPDTVRHAAQRVVFEEYPIVGFNYRMTDIQAAVGRAQLQRLPEIFARRVSLADRYTEAIRAIPGLEPPLVPDWARPNYQSYPVRVTAEYPLSRDELMQAMLDRGISTRRGIMNAHQEPAYAGAGLLPLPHSEAARDSVILLPLFSQMSEQELGRVLAMLAAPEI
jgi:nucleotide sugar dehydrogenase